MCHTGYAAQVVSEKSAVRQAWMQAATWIAVARAVHESIPPESPRRRILTPVEVAIEAQVHELRRGTLMAALTMLVALMHLESSAL